MNQIDYPEVFLGLWNVTTYQDSSWPDWLPVRESLQLRKWPCALQLLASATVHQMQVSSMAYSAAVNACSAAKGQSRWPWIVTLPATETSKIVLGRLVSFWDCFRDYVLFRRCSPGTYFGCVLRLWQKWIPSFKDCDAVAIHIECCSPPLPAPTALDWAELSTIFEWNRAGFWSRIKINLASRHCHIFSYKTIVPCKCKTV